MRTRAWRLATLLAAVGLVVTTGWRARQRPHVPTYGVMGFGFGRPVVYQDCRFHTGQDWFAPSGTPVFAIADGVVVHVGPLWYAGEQRGRGPEAIVIDHGAYYSTYSHNERARVTAGQWVERGKWIADLGSRGYSKRPHLHLEWIEKRLAPWTGNWQLPFAGCDGYRDPGGAWGWL